MTDFCQQLHDIAASATRIAFPFERKDLPKNGIYILFEKGETAHGMDRIVRIGTHTGDNNLPKRLTEHFLKENKDRSIFRKNIGLALLKRDGDPFAEQWNFDLTTREAKARLSAIIDTEKQKTVEKAVTAYICSAFTFTVVAVPTKEKRLEWETKMIGTVSNCPHCRPSKNWLGLFSPKPKISDSGLWNVLGLYEPGVNHSDITAIQALS